MTMSILALFVLGGWVSWLGTLGSLDLIPPAPAPSPPEESAVAAIELPCENLELPDGPNRDQFQTVCVLCHSPRLAFTQPPLVERQWAEIVHKMVAVYGAPSDPEQERAITAYLTAVAGRVR